MSKAIKPERLTDYISRILRGFPQGVKDAAEIHIEYYDDDRMTTCRKAAKSMRMEASEHGPVRIILSDSA